MSNAISVSDLVIQYRGKSGKAFEAVSGLSFEVRRGEVVGFLGPNGAGKSSTLKALMGFLRPHSGRCEVLGLEAGSPAAKARCGFLPEVALYYPFLSPLETLTLYGELQGLRGKPLQQEAQSLLERVGLKDAMRKQNRALSKGMLQRVGIAQAILGDPEVLILDEVTSGLDPLGRQELRNLLLEKRHAGATLFFSSHELAEVEMLCDRILMIHRGRLIEERTLADLKEELTQYWLSFTISDSSPPDVFSVPGLASSVERVGSAWKAVFRSKAALIEALNAVQRSNGRVIDVVASEGSLEDYFVSSVRRAA